MVKLNSASKAKLYLWLKGRKLVDCLIIRSDIGLIDLFKGYPGEISWVHTTDHTGSESFSVLFRDDEILDIDHLNTDLKDLHNKISKLIDDEKTLQNLRLDDDTVTYLNKVRNLTPDGCIQEWMNKDKTKVAIINYQGVLLASYDIANTSIS